MFGKTTAPVFEVGGECVPENLREVVREGDDRNEERGGRTVKER